MQQLEIKRSLFGKDICMQLTRLDDGITVLLTGGDKSHVGAISIAEPVEQKTEPIHFAAGTGVTKKQPEVTCQTISFPGHKEAVISEKWATEIAEKNKCRTIVQVGIHYDNATKEQILEIVKVTEELLEEVI